MLEGETYELYMHNNCPYASLEIVKKFEQLKHRSMIEEETSFSDTAATIDAKFRSYPSCKSANMTQEESVSNSVKTTLDDRIMDKWGNG